MSNYAKGLPVGVNGVEFQNSPPPYPALQVFNKDNAVASSVMSLNPDTTAIEVGAFGGQGVVIRWVPTTETAAAAGAKASIISSGLGANFDHFIPASQYRRFVVPKESMGQMAGGQIGSVNGLYQRVAVINAGATGSSVLLSEF